MIVIIIIIVSLALLCVGAVGVLSAPGGSGGSDMLAVGVVKYAPALGVCSRGLLCSHVWERLKTHQQMLPFALV